MRARAERARGAPGPLGRLAAGALALALGAAGVARGDADPRTRARQAFELGLRGDPATSAELAALLLDPAPEVRAAAVEALARLPGAPHTLIAVTLSDPAPEPRGSAALALARLGAPRSEDAGGLAVLIAERLEREEDEKVRWKLMFLLRSQPRLLDRPGICATALKTLSSPNFIAAAFAAQALGETREGAAHDAARRALEALAEESAFARKPDPLRRAVLGALGRSRERGGLLLLAPRAGFVDEAGRLPPPPTPWRLGPRAAIAIHGRGTVRLQLFHSEAPRAVAAFLRLAGAGGYHGAAFSFTGPADVLRQAERVPSPEVGPTPFLCGAVGALGPEAEGAGIRLFFGRLPDPELDGRATHFARVVEGMEVVDRIEEGDLVSAVEIEGLPQEN